MVFYFFNEFLLNLVFQESGIKTAKKKLATLSLHCNLTLHGQIKKSNLLTLIFYYITLGFGPLWCSPARKKIGSRSDHKEKILIRLNKIRFYPFFSV